MSLLQPSQPPGHLRPHTPPSTDCHIASCQLPAARGIDCLAQQVHTSITSSSGPIPCSHFLLVTFPASFNLLENSSFAKGDFAELCVAFPPSRLPRVLLLPRSNTLRSQGTMGAPVLQPSRKQSIDSSPQHQETELAQDLALGARLACVKSVDSHGEPPPSMPTGFAQSSLSKPKPCETARKLV